MATRTIYSFAQKTEDSYNRVWGAGPSMDMWFLSRAKAQAEVDKRNEAAWKRLEEMHARRVETFNKNVAEHNALVAAGLRQPTTWREPQMFKSLGADEWEVVEEQLDLEEEENA